jgi:hypothetical protein
VLTSFPFRNPSGIFASTERKFECGAPILRMNTAATRQVPSMILFGYRFAFFKPAERMQLKRHSKAGRKVAKCEVSLA